MAGAAGGGDRAAAAGGPSRRERDPEGRRATERDRLRGGGTIGRTTTGEKRQGGNSSREPAEVNQQPTRWLQLLLTECLFTNLLSLCSVLLALSAGGVHDDSGAAVVRAEPRRRRHARHGPRKVEAGAWRGRAGPAGGGAAAHGHGGQGGTRGQVSEPASETAGGAGCED